MGKFLRRFFRELTIGDLPLDPVWLLFREDGRRLEQAFQEFYYRKNLPRIRLAFVVGALFYGVFSFLDAYLLTDPAAVRLFYFIRFGVVIPVGIVGILLTYSPFFRRCNQPAVMIINLVGGSGIIAMILLAPPPVTYSYYAGLILVFIFIYTLTGLQFIWACATSWILVILYEIVVLGFTRTPVPIVVNNNFFFLSTNFLGMFAAYIIEVAARRDFYLAHLLRLEKDKVARARDELEDLVAARTRQLRQANDKLQVEVEEKNALLVQQELLQEQLLQSQKMEAVGLLAGGVAHDFNNLLTVINGYSDLLQATLAGNRNALDKLARIREAGERAENLTRQLLTFSRKQIIQPVDVDLNRLLRGMGKMLGRLIGEDVELDFIYGENLRLIRADIVQLEQVVLNLVINARDAMPRGGRITVATANVGREEAAGDELPGTIAGEGAVSLTVADTGPGIDSEVLPHIFEPFFTTKKNDRGTGLGLSTVYGIVKQHGGNVRVRQTSPAGTTFEVIFPAAGEAVPVPVQESGEEPRLTGGETILLVEDEDNIRDYLATVLREHGYRVQAAADAMEAMSIFTACRHEIDLLVTDVIMPKMSGRELRDRLRADRPELKYIFISGYTDEIIVQHDMDREGAHLLQKPFGPREFLLKIRQILEASA